jgi:hypothetical protein
VTNEDNLKDLNAEEVKANFDAGILAGIVGLATLIIIAMATVILVHAAIESMHSATHP